MTTVLKVQPIMQLGGHPFFKSFLERAKLLSNNRVVEKGRNLKEDIRERWETTDNPTVQRFQVSLLLDTVALCLLSHTTASQLRDGIVVKFVWPHACCTESLLVCTLLTTVCRTERSTCVLDQSLPIHLVVSKTA